jgi:hypothetical protein
MVDVLKTLEAKGVLTPQEFEALKAKVTKDEQKAAVEQQTAVQQEVQQTVQQAAPQLKTVAMQADSANDNNVTMMGSGVGFHTGRFDVSISGEVNGFYVQDRADTNPLHLSCLLCEASVGNKPSGSIRSGLLPGDLSFKISTQEHGWDVAVFFGIWPAIQNNSGAVGTVEGGVGGTSALSTPGIDFRQQFATLGRAHVGSLKIGRDLGLFGQEAILNDMTLLGAGAPGLAAAGNNSPGNVTLGRIGVGYLYTDFLPQITYTTPSSHGLQGAFGVFQPYDDPILSLSGLSSNLNGHGQPMFQGKVTYAYGKGPVKAKFWSNFITEAEQANLGGVGNLPQGQSVRATGVDYGTKLSWHGLDLVAYGYNGWGLGTTGLLWDGIGTNLAGTGPTQRGSSGYYFQPSYSHKKFFFGYSYGQSILTAANATDLSFLSSTAQSLAGLRANSAHMAQFRYAVTSWDNLVAEYVHTRSEVQTGGAVITGGDATGPSNITTSDSIALGTIVFF